jgi:hypothetical protein
MLILYVRNLELLKGQGNRAEEVCRGRDSAVVIHVPRVQTEKPSKEDDCSPTFLSPREPSLNKKERKFTAIHIKIHNG